MPLFYLISSFFFVNDIIFSWILQLLTEQVLALHL